jgi:hypothetical protein
MLTLKLLRLNYYRILVIFLGFTLFSITSAKAQESWINYVKMNDKGVMTVAVDLKYNENIPNYRNLLIVGTRFRSCLKNGLPKEKGLEELYAFSDSTLTAINKSTRNILVGIITTQCMGFDIYYVKDTVDVRKNLNRVARENFNITDTYIEITEEKKWTFYKSSLYQNFSFESLSNQSYLYDLVLQGDDLKGLRKVNHWLYFKNVKLRNNAGAELKKLKFSLDSIAYRKERKLPYELKISRKDSIDPYSINRLTSLLINGCAKYRGEYDGWGTELKVLE